MKTLKNLDAQSSIGHSPFPLTYITAATFFQCQPVFDIGDAQLNQ